MASAYYWTAKEPAVEWFTTVPFGMNPEGMAAWYSQGEIAQRHKEKLGVSDLGVIMYREMCFDQMAKVERGDETRRVLEANSRPDYRQQLEKELKEVADSEMWQAGTVVRSLRPERATKGGPKK